LGVRLLGANLVVLFLLYSMVQLGGLDAPRTSAATTGPPQYSDLAVTSVRAGTSSVFATKWSDPAGLSQYVFSFDAGAGTFVNSTSTAFSGMSNWSNTTEILGSTIGTKIQWKVYAENLNMLWNSTHFMCTVPGFDGIPLGPQYVTITDDCYDLLAYDGSTLYNLGNLPQLFHTNAGGFVGYHGIQWDPAMDTALIVGYGDALVKYTLATGQFSVLTTGLSSSVGLNALAWKPNSNSYALIPGDGGTLLQYSGGTVSLVPTGTTSNLHRVAWNPNGNYALIVGDGGTVLKFTYDGGTITSISSGVGTQLSGVGFRSDGSMALIVGSGGTVLKYTDASGSVSPLGGVGDSYVFQDTSFSRDGAYALLTSQNNVRGNLVMWAYSTGTFANVTSGNVNTANQIAFAPDGSYAYVTTTSGVLLKQAYGALSAAQIPLTNNRLRGIDFHLSPGSGTTTTTTSSTTLTTASITTMRTTMMTSTSQSTSTTTSTSSSTSAISTSSATSTATSTASTATTTTSSATNTTTTLTTSTSISSTSSSTTISFPSTTSSSTTGSATSTTANAAASSISLTNSSTSGGGGGIPEFPFQLAEATAFTVLLITSYLFARRRQRF
jgi:hypothetical protein